MAGKVKHNIQGQVFGNWVVGSYLGKSKFMCTCQNCGNSREISSYFLINNKAPKCECQSSKAQNKLIDLTGKVFGDWEVISYAGNKKWVCRCSCSNLEHPVERVVAGQDLRTGKSTGCGHRNSNVFIDLSNRQIGDWTVLDYVGKGFWNCRCSCGDKIHRVSGSLLRSGKSKSCGHSTTGFKDLTGKAFGNWLVLRKSDNQTSASDTLWTCQCQCESGTIQDIGGYVLRKGISKSCGCLSGKFRQDSLSGKLRQDSLSGNPKISKESILNDIKAYLPCAESGQILDGLELDLYFPDKKLAIEFNGEYWHSALKKSKQYHQDKTIACAKKGIQLIHIFEYEWNNASTKDKLLDMIKSKVYPGRNTVLHARKCIVQDISREDAYQFCGRYHIQNWAEASISIGLTFNNEIVSVMTFGKPRFSKDAEYELIRYVNKASTVISGGAEKLFHYFVDKYSPKSIITYSDISKFTGGVYSRIGFKTVGITQPSYKWVGHDPYKILTRYQTTKQSLIKRGLGKEEETEADIMYRLGYYRVYDCGNLKFIWGI